MANLELGDLDYNGLLSIQRKGKIKSQYCPYDGRERVRCGDWCPNFGEPTNIDSNEVLLITCHRGLIFKTFTDNRNGGSL